MAVLKVIEVHASSKVSWEDAVQKSIKRLGRTVKRIKSAYVQDMTTSIEGRQVVSYNCTLKVSYELPKKVKIPKQVKQTKQVKQAK